MKPLQYLRTTRLYLLCLITFLFFQCSTEDDSTEDFKYIDNVFAPNRITERELAILDECLQTTITDSTALNQHVIGTWRLIGYSNYNSFQNPEYSYQQIVFGPTPGYGLMEFLSPSGVILGQFSFTWSVRPGRSSLISEPYIRNVVGLRFCEEYAYISFADVSSKFIFQKQ